MKSSHILKVLSPNVLSSKIDLALGQIQRRKDLAHLDQTLAVPSTATCLLFALIFNLLLNFREGKDKCLGPALPSEANANELNEVDGAFHHTLELINSG